MDILFGVGFDACFRDLAVRTCWVLGQFLSVLFHCCYSTESLTFQFSKSLDDDLERLLITLVEMFSSLQQYERTTQLDLLLFPEMKTEKK